MSTIQDIDGYALGGRQAMAQELAARKLHLAEPVGFLVAELWNGRWLISLGYTCATVEEARELASQIPDGDQQFGVLAVLPVDGGRLYGGAS